jgi:four helix bundle protein
MREGLDQLEERTKQFAIQVIRLCARVESEPAMRNAANQLNRAAGSVAANHRAMRRARSTREFAAKLQIVNEEIDECSLWLDIVAARCAHLDREFPSLRRESSELRSIFAKARATTRARF